jgi:hypothetical protein
VAKHIRVDLPDHRIEITDDNKVDRTIDDFSTGRQGTSRRRSRAVDSTPHAASGCTIAPHTETLTAIERPCRSPHFLITDRGRAATPVIRTWRVMAVFT